MERCGQPLNRIPGPNLFEWQIYTAGFGSSLRDYPMMSARLLVASLVLAGLLILASCSTIQKPLQGKQQSLLVTATAFNSLPKQGQGNPNVGAWGDRIKPGVNAVAVSEDLVSLGLTRGTKVRIEEMKNEYVVLDRMPAKWKKRIDIYMGNDLKAARAWGKREVNIYWTVAD